jgi:hypothetical protein
MSYHVVRRPPVAGGTGYVPAEAGSSHALATYAPPVTLIQQFSDWAVQVDTRGDAVVEQHPYWTGLAMLACLAGVLLFVMAMIRVRWFY